MSPAAVVAARSAAFTIRSQRSNSPAAGTSRRKGKGSMGAPEKKLRNKSIRSLLKTPAFEGRSFKSIMNNEALLRVSVQLITKHQCMHDLLPL
jgi:hypothetical protein